MMIALKYILATILAALPFLCAYAFKKDERHGDGSSKSSLARFLARFLPLAWNLCLAFGSFFKRLYNGMRRSRNSRKFYTLLLLMILLVITYVDFSATEAAQDIIKNTTATDSRNAVHSAVRASIYKPMVSNVIALFVCQLMTFVLFSYKIADKLLTWISINWFFLIFTNCLFWAVVAVVDQSWFIMAEVETVYLMAAIYYPHFTGIPDPKGRKAIPVDMTQETYRMAA